MVFNVDINDQSVRVDWSSLWAGRLPHLDRWKVTSNKMQNNFFWTKALGSQQYQHKVLHREAWASQSYSWAVFLVTDYQNPEKRSRYSRARVRFHQIHERINITVPSSGIPPKKTVNSALVNDPIPFFIYVLHGPRDPPQWPQPHKRRTRWRMKTFWNACYAFLVRPQRNSLLLPQTSAGCFLREPSLMFGISPMNSCLELLPKVAPSGC